jgi:hypothetical protein
MADDLLTTLRTAGEMLDRRGVEAMGAAPADGDHTPVYGLTPLPPRAPRRPPVWLGAAAAALVLMAGVLAVAAWNRRDVTNVASMPSTVALVLSDPDAWDTISVDDPSRQDHSMVPPFDTGVFVPAGSPDDRTQMVSVNVVEGFDERGVYGGDDTERVEAFGLEGHLYRDPSGVERQQLFVLGLEVGGEPAGVALTSGTGVAVESLFELAAGLDLERTLAEQALDGWTFVTSFDQHLGSRTHSIFAGSTTPMSYDSVWLSVSTITGATDEIRWLLDEPFNAVEREMRGRPAWVTVNQYGATAVWVESPGVVVRAMVNLSSTEETTMVDRLVEAVEGLVPVDEAGWRAFVSANADDPSGTGAMTTTTWEAGESTGRDGATAQMAGPLDDGDDEFQLWLHGDSGELCWALFGSTYGEGCGDAVTGAQVLYDALGEAVLVYGLLPDGATWVDATFRWSGREESTGSATARPLWAVAVPAGARTATIRFMDDGGDEVERHEVELTLEG